MLYVEFLKFDALEKFLIFFLFFCSCEILVGELKFLKFGILYYKIHICGCMFSRCFECGVGIFFLCLKVRFGDEDIWC